MLHLRRTEGRRVRRGEGVSPAAGRREPGHLVQDHHGAFDAQEGFAQLGFLAVECAKAFLAFVVFGAESGEALLNGLVHPKHRLASNY